MVIPASYLVAVARPQKNDAKKIFFGNLFFKLDTEKKRTTMFKKSASEVLFAK